MSRHIVEHDIVYNIQLRLSKETEAYRIEVEKGEGSYTAIVSIKAKHFKITKLYEVHSVQAIYKLLDIATELAQALTRVEEDILKIQDYGWKLELQGESNDSL